MAASLLGVLMFGKLFKSVFMLCFYAASLSLVVGIWDYTRQAKEADYQYSFEEYKLSVIDRYGAEAAIVFAVAETVKGGALRGLEIVEETGLLAKVGISLPDAGLEPSDAISGAVDPLQASLILASTRVGFAPETSLFPRARVLR